MKATAANEEGRRCLRYLCSGRSALRKTLAGMASVFYDGITWIPDDVDLSALSLAQGGLSEFDYEDDLWEPFYEQVSAFMKELSSAVIVSEAPDQKTHPFEKQRAIPGVQRVRVVEGTTQPADLEAFFEGYLFGRNLRQRSAIEEFVDETIPFGRQLFVLTSANLEYGDTTELPEFVSLIQQTKVIISDAFDGSGIVKWTRIR